MTCSACKSAPKDGKACRYCGFIAQDARLERLADDLRKPEADRERVEFIRRAAREIWGGSREQDYVSSVTNQSRWSWAWSQAKAAWETKPDDC